MGAFGTGAMGKADELLEEVVLEPQVEEDLGFGMVDEPLDIADGEGCRAVVLARAVLGAEVPEERFLHPYLAAVENVQFHREASFSL